MVYIAYFTELNSKIWYYAQQRRICRKNCKYALDERFHGHFRPRRKPAKSCHPGARQSDPYQVCNVSSSLRHITGKLSLVTCWKTNGNAIQQPQPQKQSKEQYLVAISSFHICALWPKRTTSTRCRHFCKRSFHTSSAAHRVTMMLRCREPKNATFLVGREQCRQR